MLFEIRDRTDSPDTLSGILRRHLFRGRGNKCQQRIATGSSTNRRIRPPSGPKPQGRSDAAEISKLGRPRKLTKRSSVHVNSVNAFQAFHRRADYQSEVDYFGFFAPKGRQVAAMKVRSEKFRSSKDRLLHAEFSLIGAGCEYRTPVKLYVSINSF